jgi:hypothetical protein
MVLLAGQRVEVRLVKAVWRWQRSRIPPTGPAVLVADTDFISAMTLDRQNVFFATEGAPAGLFRVAR